MAIAREPLSSDDADAPGASRPGEVRPADARPASTARPAPTAWKRPFALRDLNPRVAVAAALLVAGVVLVILGWYGVAQTNILTEQIPYLISGGLLGVALIIVAGVLAAGASVERQTRLLRDDLRSALDALAASPREPGATPARVLVVPGGRAYHVPGCPIPEGKDVTTLPLTEARETGFTPCKLCEPPR